MITKLKTESIFLTIVTVILLALLVHKLDYSALQSYDEAWYGEITRNLILSKNPFTLTYNGAIFSDHPPLGFMFMAIPVAILGSTEFSVRITSAVLGVGCIVLMYLLGKRIGGRAVGISAAAILISCMWFVFRARSGNLDVPFLFLEILTVYLLLNKDEKSIYFSALSFAALILTKTLVGIGLLPIILLILWQRRKKVKRSTLTKALILFLTCVLPWYIFNQINDQHFLRHHFFEIGVRGNENNYSYDSLASSLQYLAIGIGKWYKIFIASTVLGIIFFLKQKDERSTIKILFVWFLGFSTFLFSSQTEIWHLLPLYPIISLFIPFTVIKTANLLTSGKLATNFILVTGFLGLAMYQFSQFSNLTYPAEPVFSSERDISIKAGAYEKIYLMDTFLPAAVFYSQQSVNPLYWSPNAYQDMTAMLKSGTEGVFIINNELKQRLETDMINFVELDRSNDYYVISSKEN